MRIAAVLTVTLLALAGCAGEPAEKPQEAPEDVVPIYQAPVEPVETVTVVPTSPRDHLLTITPEAPVAGFIVDVPEGSAYELGTSGLFWDLDLAGRVVADEAPESLALFVFSLGDGALLGGHLMVPNQASTYLTAALATHSDNAADLSNWFMTLDGDLEGSSVGIVVAGSGVASETSIVLHVGEGRLDREADEAELFQGTPGELVPVGTGTAFDYEIRSEVYFGLLATPGLLGVEFTAGAPMVDDRLDAWVPPHGGARDATVRADSDIASGWSFANTAMLTKEGVLDWQHEVSASGASKSDEGVLAWAGGYGLIATGLVFGLPVGTAAGDGDGAPRATLELQAASDGELWLLLSEVVAFDQPLSKLIGVNAPAQADVLAGLLMLDGAAGTMTVDAGAPISHAGFWPRDPSP